jgi:hypothetical protein
MFPALAIARTNFRSSHFSMMCIFAHHASAIEEFLS